MWSLVWRLRMIMGPNFRIVRNKSGYIFFKDMKYRANYTLYYVGMSVEQILEIARIVGEVFSKNERDNRQQRKDVSTRNLNSPTDSSKQFVARVLNLDCSSLHKFLLLTSGAYLSSPGDDDLLVTLAEAKSESCGDLLSIHRSNRIFEILQETYVLPGVTDDLAFNAGVILNAAMMRHSVDTIARLLVFVAKEDPKLTLSAHMRLKDNEEFATIKPIETFDAFRFIEEFLARKPGYSELGHRFTVRELLSLQFLMSNGYSRIPEDFLFNRVISMVNTPTQKRPIKLLALYLSTSEILSVGQTTVDAIDPMISNSTTRKNESIVYAAIAELLVQKGGQRALDAIHELKHLSSSKAMTIESTEATVLLILEDLKPENDEMPFSWAAQLSEHSWVLNSHASADGKFSLLV